MRLFVAVLILICVVGCAVVPSGVSWSPDGQAAIYGQKVIDTTGKSVQQFDPFDGPAVWSADSNSLYFIGSGITGSNVPVTPLRRWVDGPDADKDIAKPTTLPVGYPSTAVYRRRGGKTVPVVSLWHMWVCSLAISSDQNWLLIRAFNIHGVFDFQPGLLAYQLQSKKLYVVTNSCQQFCFTGPSRVAIVDNKQIFETTLDESLPALAFTPILNVLPDSTEEIAGLGDTLLVLTAQATFPAPATQPDVSKIYTVNRDGKQFHELATTGRPMMSLSPDGKHVLFFRSTDQSPDQLAMMNIDGTQQRMLMDLTPFNNGLPLMPTWHGNDRITFAATTGTLLPPVKDDRSAGGGPKIAYDIVDYSIPLTGPMQPAQTLSKAWSLEQKPSLPQMTEAVPKEAGAKR